MRLKTQVLLARILLIISALSVFVLVLTTFDNPNTSNWVATLSMVCLLLMLYHNSLVKKLKNQEKDD